MGLRIVAKDMGSMVVVATTIVADKGGSIDPTEVRGCVECLYARQLGDEFPGKFVVVAGAIPVWLQMALIEPLKWLFTEWDSFGVHDSSFGVIVVDTCAGSSHKIGEILPFDLSQESLDKPGWVLYES